MDLDRIYAYRFKEEDQAKPKMVRTLSRTPWARHFVGKQLLLIGRK